MEQIQGKREFAFLFERFQLLRLTVVSEEHSAQATLHKAEEDIANARRQLAEARSRLAEIDAALAIWRGATEAAL